MSVLAKRAFGRKNDVDMTQGNILKKILLFAFPLLVGNLFQQLYNLVDAWVISMTGMTDAYAAVGSVGPVINILIGFFVGLSSGASVVISQFYGAGNKEKVSEAVHTSVAATLIMGVVLTFLGIALTPMLLDFMLKADESAVYPHAEAYLNIYFAGILGLVIYNMSSGIMRAVGDSRRPFLFLVVSTVTNIILDFLFVFAFNMGVAGVALATVIAQLFSATLAVICLIKSTNCVKLIVKRIRIEWPMLKKIVLVGFPAGLQMALTAFSNVFVQSYIAKVNGNQTEILAGWTTYNKIDMFMFLPPQSIALAVTTFVGQNMGTGNHKRARKGTLFAIISAMLITVLVIVCVMFSARWLVGIFSKEPNVIEYGARLLIVLSPFYILTCINQIVAASLRGMGNTTAPMIIMLLSFVGFRQIYLYFVYNFVSKDLIPIAMGYPIGWLVCSITITAYYLLYKPKKNKIIES